MAGTVSIACKLPHGLHLRLFKMEEYQEPVLGGGTRTAQRAIPLPERVTIHGVAAEAGKAPRNNPLMIGGYALTPNVDADFWAAWLKANADSDVVRNKLVFAHEKQGAVEGQAKEHLKLRSGLEPIDPTRLPKGIETSKAA